MATCSVIDASSPDISEKNQKEGEKITVNFGIFFDGTNNQRLQVAMGKLNREKNADKKKEKIKESIKNLGGTFDENQFKKNGNIKYTIKSNASSDNEKEIEKLNKKIAKYNKKHGNRPDAIEHETIESFTWDDASGIKKDKDTIEQTLNKKSGFRVGMPRSPMQGVDFTNIARLEPLYNCKDATYTYKIYVTGSGTFADLDKGSDVTGLAAGQSSAGVVQKVKDALDAIAKIIYKIKSNNNLQESSVTYQFNVFGFSRGSTEARLFVDLCNTRKGKRHKILEDIISKYNGKFIDNKNEKSAISFAKQKSIEFPFVGIFDTVSSVGINPGIWNNVILSGGLKVAEEATPSVSNYHKDNKNDLGLDTLVYSEKVKHVVHICALDEFRENFALQVLPTTNVKAEVEQLFLPGVHADIGGGDLDGYGDEKHIPTVHKGEKLFIPEIVTPGKTQHQQDLLEITIKNLESLGWIKGNSDSSLMPDITEEKNGVIVLQKYAERGYTFLPQNLMAEKAIEKNSCEFNGLKEKYAIPADLPQDFGEIKEQWKGDDCKYGHCFFPSKDKYKLLRQKRLHFSSCIKKTAGLAYVNGPNLTESDDKENPLSYYDRFLDYHPHPKGWYGKITKSGLKDIVFEKAGNQNDDDYLGEAVVVFNGKNHNEEYDVNFHCTATVTVYGKDGNILNALGATTPGPGHDNDKKKPNTIKEGFYYAFYQDMGTSLFGTRGPRLHNIANQAIKQAVPKALEEFRQSREDRVKKALEEMEELRINQLEIINLIKNNEINKTPINKREKCIHELANMVKNKIDHTVDDLITNPDDRKDIKEKIINKRKIIPDVTPNKTYRIAKSREHKKEEDLILPAIPEKASEIFLHRTDRGGYAKNSSKGCLIIDEKKWEDVEKNLDTSQDIFIYVKRS